MSPVRILILGVLFYLLYKLLFKRKPVEKVKEQKNSSTSAPTQDELVEDPICNTYVPKSQALSVQYDNKTYYFCSDECSKTFQDTQIKKGDHS